MTIQAMPGSDLANARAAVTALRAELGDSDPSPELAGRIERAVAHLRTLEDAAERGRVASEARSVPTGGALTEYRGWDGQQTSRKAAGSGWTRQDGRGAAVERGQRFGDHPVVQEHAARRAAAERPVIEAHGNLGNLVRSLTTGGSSAVIPTDWSSSIIDKARNYSAVLSAESTLVPMDANTIQLGRLTTDPVSAFRTEGSLISASDPAFDSVTLQAKSLNALTVASVEFLQDAVDAEEVITNALAKSMALELDLNALFGGLTTGSEVGSTGINRTLPNPPSPRGVLATLLAVQPANVLGGATNGTTQTSTTPWQEVLQTIYQPQLFNEVPNALIWSPSLELRYANMYDTTNQVLRHPAAVDAIQQVKTNQIPSNLTVGSSTTNMTDLFVADWTKLLIGQRLEITIQVLTERYAEYGQVGLVAWFRGDVAMARPKAFSVYRYLHN